MELNKILNKLALYGFRGVEDTVAYPIVNESLNLVKQGHDEVP